MKLMVAVALVTALGLSACEVNTPAGAPGPAGAKGAAGSDGANGANGAAGAQGAQGNTGKPAANTVVVVPVPDADKH